MIDFLGIGAQKAGTTWLYENLRQHPNIAFPGGKEVHFWDQRKIHYSDQTREVDWYTQLFSGHPNKIQGEITPAYAILPVEIIQQIHTLNPKLRLIYLVRNPIDRTWSAALMALKQIGMTLEEASEQWFSDFFHAKATQARSRYQQCISNWQSVFPAEQLLVLQAEDIAQAPLWVIEHCCRHLGIPADFFRQHPPATLHQRIFSGNRPPLPASLHQLLEDLYKNERDAIPALVTHRY